MKRKLTEEEEEHRATAKIVAISRTISACQRCRTKKTKCDSNIPCSKCQKAGVECIGLDSTGRAVPRSYLVYLEDKVNALERLLEKHGIEFTDIDPLRRAEREEETTEHQRHEHEEEEHEAEIDTPNSETSNSLNLKAPVPSNNSSSFYIGDSSGISFAKLLFTAVKFYPSTINEHNPITTRPPNSANKSTKVIPLPSQSVAEQFIKSYFEQSNPQLPILHREEFIERYFNPIYGELSPDITLASNNTPISQLTKAKKLESSWYQNQVYSKVKLFNPADVPEKLHRPLFFLFIVFAVSSSINLQQHSAETSDGYREQALQFIDDIYSSSDRLECLQGLLLLTQYSIMRPTTPGVWYTLGTTLRLTVDLGLHTEKMNIQFPPFVKDLRRRLFWCAYSLDRQICVYLGRPFGIPEEAISTLYPIDLDDKFLKKSDQKDYQRSMIMQQSYKTVSIFFFKIRKLQSEILQTLYFPNSSIPRPYQSLEHWKNHLESQIEQWYANLPTTAETNCNFNKTFFQLNYHHTKMLLFGLTPKSQLPNWFKIHESAHGIISAYYHLFSGKGVNYTWLTVHNLFMAGTSYLYAIYNSLEFLNVSYKEYKESVTSVCKVLEGLRDECEGAGPCLEIFKILGGVVERIKFLQTRQPAHQQAPPPTQHPTIYAPQTHPQTQGISPIFQDTEDDLTRFFEKLQGPEFQTVISTDEEWNKSLKFPSSYQTPPPTHSNGPNSTSHPLSQTQSLNSTSMGTPQGQQSTNLKGTTNVRTPNFNETEKIFELMNQVSHDAIWDQFFNNSTVTTNVSGHQTTAANSNLNGAVNVDVSGGTGPGVIGGFAMPGDPVEDADNGSSEVDKARNGNGETQRESD